MIVENSVENVEYRPGKRLVPWGLPGVKIVKNLETGWQGIVLDRKYKAWKNGERTIKTVLLLLKNPVFCNRIVTL